MRYSTNPNQEIFMILLSLSELGPRKSALGSTKNLCATILRFSRPRSQERLKRQLKGSSNSQTKIQMSLGASTYGYTLTSLNTRKKTHIRIGQLYSIFMFLRRRGAYPNYKMWSSIKRSCFPRCWDVSPVPKLRMRGKIPQKILGFIVSWSTFMCIIAWTSLSIPRKSEEIFRGTFLWR